MFGDFRTRRVITVDAEQRCCCLLRDSFFGGGCAVLESELVSDGTIRLEEVPSDTARLSRVRVYEDGGELAVYGKIGRRADV